MSEELAWPPKREDLERLYVGQKLSAAKIADAYGLKSVNPKSSETLVLYHLKRFGIARRDRAEHIRKVTSQMVDGWLRRYEGGESLKQIARSEVDSVTVWNHLKKRGVVLRDKVEAQVKAVSIHPKRPFEGSDLEKAYISGLAIGDFFCSTHGASVRARLGTTHPAMIELFRELFSPYGPIYQYPKRSTLTGFEWSLDCDLDRSFDFLLERNSCLKWIGESEDVFLSFLAGFFDADGSLFFHRKHERGGFEITLSNMNIDLLEAISVRVTAMGFAPRLRLDRQRPDRGVKNGGSSIYRLSLWRHDDVIRLLKLLPIRNREKVRKAAIALTLPYRSSHGERRQVIERWEECTTSIRFERDMCVRKASEVFGARNEAKWG